MLLNYIYNQGNRKKNVRGKWLPGTALSLTWKKQKNPPQKNFLYLKKWNFIAPRWKHPLYFPKWSFLASYFPYVSGKNFPSSKSEKRLLWKDFLYFRKWNFSSPKFKKLLYFKRDLRSPKNKQKNLLWRNFLSLMSFLQSSQQSRMEKFPAKQKYNTDI